MYPRGRIENRKYHEKNTQVENKSSIIYVILEFFMYSFEEIRKPVLFYHILHIDFNTEKPAQKNYI